MALFVGIKIDDDEKFQKLLDAMKEIGIDCPWERKDESKDFIFSVGEKQKYLVGTSEYSDEEIQEEYLRRYS